MLPYMRGREGLTRSALGLPRFVKPRASLQSRELEALEEDQCRRPKEGHELTAGAVRVIESHTETWYDM